MFKLHPFFEKLLNETFAENPFKSEQTTICDKCHQLQNEIQENPDYEVDRCSDYTVINKELMNHLEQSGDDYGASQHQSNQSYLCNECYTSYRVHMNIGSEYPVISFDILDVKNKNSFHILRTKYQQIYFKEFAKKFEENYQRSEEVIQVYTLLHPGLKRSNHDYLINRGNNEESLKIIDVHESLGSFLETSNYIGGAFNGQTLLELSIKIKDLEYELGEFYNGIEFSVNTDDILNVKVFDPFNRVFVDKDSIDWKDKEHIEELKSLYNFRFNKYSGMSEIDIKINLYLNKIYSEVFYKDALDSFNFKKNLELAFKKIRENKEIKELKENLKKQLNSSDNS